MMDARAHLWNRIALVTEPTRLAMLMQLMDDTSRPASELARAAGVSMSAASTHLGKLRQAGIVRVRAQGRNRYYELARADVARAVEALAALAPRDASAPAQPSELQRARTCYDHLAGQLGVEITAALVAKGWLVLRRNVYRLETEGTRGLAQLGIDPGALGKNARRPFAVPCIDWSERRPHVAGALGAALASRMFELRWLERTSTPRAVRVTVRGRAALHRDFGVVVV